MSKNSINYKISIYYKKIQKVNAPVLKFPYKSSEEIDRDVIENVYASTTAPYFNVSVRQNCIKDSKFTMFVRKVDVPDSIKEIGYYEFWVKIQSAEDSRVIITPDSIKTRVNFYKEKIVALPEDDFEGKVEWRSGCRPSFMTRIKCFSPIEPDTISVYWKDNIAFNTEAQKNPAANVHCVIDASECSLSPDKYKVFYGDEEVGQTGFLIANKGIKDLKVKVNSGVKSGEYTLIVKCKGLDSIDRIQGFGNFADYSFPICVQVDHKRNYGGVVFWAIIILLFLVVIAIINAFVIQPYLVHLREENDRLKKQEQARKEFNDLLTNVLDSGRKIRCRMNSKMMKNVLNNTEELSLRHDPDYLACAIYNEIHVGGAVIEAVFDEFGFYDVLSVLPKEEIENKKCDIEDNRVAHFKSIDLPADTLVLLTRKDSPKINVAIYRYNNNEIMWKKNYEETERSFAIALDENKFEIKLY